jgi:hypothetical protein
MQEQPAAVQYQFASVGGMDFHALNQAWAWRDYHGARPKSNPAQWPEL